MITKKMFDERRRKESCSFIKGNVGERGEVWEIWGSVGSLENCGFFGEMGWF